MKKLFAITAVLCLALFATSAVAAGPATATASATIALNATVDESASILLSASGVNFDIKNINATTAGSNAVTVTGHANIAKGRSAMMTLIGTDLVGTADGGIIPAVDVECKTTQSAGYSPIDANSYFSFLATPAAAQGANGVVLTSSLLFQIKPVSVVPDDYVGSATVTLWVL